MAKKNRKLRTVTTRISSIKRIRDKEYNQSEIKLTFANGHKCTIKREKSLVSEDMFRRIWAYAFAEDEITLVCKASKIKRVEYS